MIKLMSMLKELRSREEGEMTLAGLISAFGALTILVVLSAFPTLTSSEALNNQRNSDTTQASEEVATDLRYVFLEASTCVANYDAKEDKFGTYSSGEYTAELIRTDINDCLAPVIGSSLPTMHYEIKRSGDNFLCIAGYDTARNTDKYTPNKPYMYSGSNTVFSENMPSSCVTVPVEGQPFNWVEMRTKK